jgi:predicted XRE-type DNA-binding protein
VTRGSGNVFGDLGLHDAEDHLAKARLVSELKHIVDRKGWTHACAAEVVGMAEPDVSRLLRGHSRTTRSTGSRAACERPAAKSASLCAARAKRPAASVTASRSPHAIFNERN